MGEPVTATADASASEHVVSAAGVLTGGASETAGLGAAISNVLVPSPSMVNVHGVFD